MEKLNYQKIGSRLRQAREYLGLTQEHVASILNVGRDAIIRIEKGNRKIDVEELLNFSKLYHISISELTDQNPSPDYNEVSFARGFNNLSSQDKKEIIDLIKFKNSMKSKEQ